MLRLAAVLLLLSGPVSAGTLSGVRFPDTYPVAGYTLVLNGMGLRTVTLLHIRTYVAGLYLVARSSDPRQIVASREPKVLLMQFLHAASKKQVQDHFQEGVSDNCGQGGCDPADKVDFDRMVNAAPAVKVGDTFTFVITQDGMQFYANNQLTGSTRRPSLARQFLMGFIGDTPPTPEVRRGLLGLGN